MKPRTIELLIEELVLEGFPPGDHHRIAQAVEREMHRLLSGQALPQRISSASGIQQMDGGAFEVAQGQTPERVGAQVSQRIFEAWKQ